jgi:hypothetical protein
VWFIGIAAYAAAAIRPASGPPSADAKRKTETIARIANSQIPCASAEASAPDIAITEP